MNLTTTSNGSEATVSERNSSHRSRQIKSLASLLIVFIVFILYTGQMFRLISRYAVNIFFSDQWDFNNGNPLLQTHPLAKYLLGSTGHTVRGWVGSSRKWFSRPLRNVAEEKTLWEFLSFRHSNPGNLCSFRASGQHGLVLRILLMVRFRFYSFCFTAWRGAPPRPLLNIRWCFSLIF